MNSEIVILRDKQFKDRLRTYRIMIDGVERGKIKANEVLKIPVSEGRHLIEARIDWCASPTVEVNVGAGKTVKVAVSNDIPLLLISLAIIFRRKKYLNLKVIED